MKKNISNNDDIVVSVKDLSKSFKLPHNKQNSIKSALINIVKGGDRSFETQKVLKDISFDIKKGDFFGIVGRNGSGKSTLLKLLSGIYNPDKGSIKIEGSVVPFIELGVGFNPELTGKENVFLNGALLGFSHADMVKMYDDIVEFAELGRFMDQKLKNYSSGMQVRLAFSIAIKAQGDILILDEVLAVGDEAFQRKCNDFFESIKKDKSKTVILVTHSMDSVRQYCNKAMMLHNGKIVRSGSPEDVANEYSIENLKTEDTGDKIGRPDEGGKVDNFSINVNSKKILTEGDWVDIDISYDTDIKEGTMVRMSFMDADRNVPIYDTASGLEVTGVVNLKFRAKFTEINDLNMRILATVRDRKDEVLYYIAEDNAPLIAYRRTDYKDIKKKNTWAILHSRGKWQTIGKP